MTNSIRSSVFKKIKILYTCCHSRNRPVFCSVPSAKTCPFFCRAKRAFPSGKTLILPISRDSRYNTLHFASKVVCQRVPLWKPYFVGVCSHTSSKMQNKRHRPARSRCCSIPLICLHGLLILSPILTVLFYHFCMDCGFADAKFGSGGADRGPVLYDVKSKALRPLLHISLQSTTLPAFCCFILCGPKQAYARGKLAAPCEKILENQKNRDRITITILLQKEC